MAYSISNTFVGLRAPGLSPAIIDNFGDQTLLEGALSEGSVQVEIADPAPFEISSGFSLGTNTHAALTTAKDALLGRFYELAHQLVEGGPALQNVLLADAVVVTALAGATAALGMLPVVIGSVTGNSKDLDRAIAAGALKTKIGQLLWMVQTEMPAGTEGRGQVLRELDGLLADVKIAETRLSKPVIGYFANGTLSRAGRRFNEIAADIERALSPGVESADTSFANGAGALERTTRLAETPPPMASGLRVQKTPIGLVDFKTQARTGVTEEVVVDLSGQLSPHGPDVTFTIGRGENGIATQGVPRVTVNNSYASKDHARVTISSGGRVTVEDLGSTNGTSIAGGGPVPRGTSKTVHIETAELTIYVGNMPLHIKLPPSRGIWDRTWLSPERLRPTGTAEPAQAVDAAASRSGPVSLYEPEPTRMTVKRISTIVASAIDAKQRGLRVSVKTNGVTMIEVTSADPAVRGSVNVTFPPEASLDQMAQTVGYVVKRTDLFRQADGSPTLNLTIRFDPQDIFDNIMRTLNVPESEATKGMITILGRNNRSMATTYRVSTTGVNGKLTANDLIQADGTLPTVEITLPWSPDEEARSKMIDGARTRATDAIRVGERPEGVESITSALSLDEIDR